MLSPFECLCRNFILPEFRKPCLFLFCEIYCTLSFFYNHVRLHPFRNQRNTKKSPRNIEAIKLKIPKILKESESKLFLFCVIAKSASSASTSISIVVPGFIIITFPAVFGLDLFPLIVCAHIRIFVFCFRHVLFLLYSYENFLNGFSYRFYRDPYNGAKTLGKGKSGLSPQTAFFWQGWLDSNQRMTDPETVALPLGDTPLSFVSMTLPRESSVGRDDRIRTCDLLIPNQVRYQTALRPAYNARTPPDAQYQAPPDHFNE